MIEVGHNRVESPPTATTTTTTTTNVERRLTASQQGDDQLLVNRGHHSNVSASDWTVDGEVASDATASLDGVPETDVESWTSPLGSRRSVQLFVPELVGGGGQNSRLTVEDIYIEAMTLDAEIRVFRRRLDAAGRRELSRIIEFCRDALHRKLLLRSVEQAQGGIGAGLAGRRAVSSENLSTQTDFVDSKPLELIAETSV